MNKILHEPFLGNKSILIILSIAFLIFLTGCTEKNKDNVTAVDTNTYQSSTDVKSDTSEETNNSTDNNVPSCH